MTPKDPATAWHEVGLNHAVHLALTEKQTEAEVAAILTQVSDDLDRLTTERAEVEAEALDPATSDEGVAQRRQQCEELDFKIKRLGLWSDKLKEELELAKIRDRETESRRIYEEAKQQLAAANKDLEAKAAPLVNELRGLFEAGRNALAAMAKANASLPTGEAPLCAPHQVALLTRKPEKVLSEKTVSVWFNEDTGEVVPETALRTYEWLNETLESLRKAGFAAIKDRSARAILKRVVEQRFIPAHTHDWLSDEGSPAPQVRYFDAQPDEVAQSEVHLGGKIQRLRAN